MTTGILGTILVIVVLLAAAFYLSRFMMKRALRTLVSSFRKLGAVSVKSAATYEALGLGPVRMFDRMFRVRDYRPHALNLLVQADIVRSTEDGRLYLSEAALENSALKKFAGIK